MTKSTCVTNNHFVDVLVPNVFNKFPLEVQLKKLLGNVRKHCSFEYSRNVGGNLFQPVKGVGQKDLCLSFPFLHCYLPAGVTEPEI